MKTLKSQYRNIVHKGETYSLLSIEISRGEKTREYVIAPMSLNDKLEYYEDPGDLGLDEHIFCYLKDDKLYQKNINKIIKEIYDITGIYIPDDI